MEYFNEVEDVLICDLKVRYAPPDSLTLCGHVDLWSLVERFASPCTVSEDQDSLVIDRFNSFQTMHNRGKSIRSLPSLRTMAHACALE